MNKRTITTGVFLISCVLVVFAAVKLYAQSAAEKQRIGSAGGLQKMPAYDPSQVKGGREADVQPKVTEDKCATLPQTGFLSASIVSYQTSMSSTEKSETTALASKLQNRVTCFVGLSTICGEGMSGFVSPHIKHIENNAQADLLCETLKSAFLAGRAVIINYDNGHDEVKDTFYIYGVSIPNES